MKPEKRITEYIADYIACLKEEIPLLLILISGYLVFFTTILLSTPGGITTGPLLIILLSALIIFSALSHYLIQKNTGICQEPEEVKQPSPCVRKLPSHEPLYMKHIRGLKLEEGANCYLHIHRDGIKIRSREKYDLDLDYRDITMLKTVRDKSALPMDTPYSEVSEVDYTYLLLQAGDEYIILYTTMYPEYVEAFVAKVKPPATPLPNRDKL